MRRPIAVTALALLAVPASAQAPQGLVEFTPRLAPGEPLTMELRNLSKLPVRLEVARLTFPDTPGTAPCVLSLPNPVSLGPAEMKTVTLVAHGDLIRCLRPSGAGASQVHQVSLLSTRAQAQADTDPPASGRSMRQSAHLSYDIAVGPRVITGTAVWSFVVE